MYWLILNVLGVWRVTHLLHAEDGPGRILAKVRERMRPTWVGRAVECFYCLSVWVAIPFAAWQGETWRERLLLWPALSGAAILLERVTGRNPAPPPAVYYEDPPEEARS